MDAAIQSCPNGHSAPAGLACEASDSRSALPPTPCPSAQAALTRGGRGATLSLRPLGPRFPWVDPPSLGVASLPTCVAQTPARPTVGGRRGPGTEQHLVRRGL